MVTVIKQNKVMRHLIIYILLLANCYSHAQKIFEKKIPDEYQLAKFFEHKFDMYINNCSDTILNEVAIKIVISHSDVIKNPSNLSTANEVDFSCINQTDSALLNRIYKILSKNETLKNKKCLVHGMLYKRNVYLFYVLVFTSKNFERYLNKSKKSLYSIKHPSGEIEIKDKVILSKYANAYILTGSVEVLNCYSFSLVSASMRNKSKALQPKLAQVND
ncbi:MAG: hypothetical protein JST75_21615 [Bacteroidetes bacterium]|nr:hypothetical protein [Bacteroidota bacterium]